MRFDYFTAGATATDPNPSRNKIDMAGISLREAEGTLGVSFIGFAHDPDQNIVGIINKSAIPCASRYISDSV